MSAGVEDALAALDQLGQASDVLEIEHEPDARRVIATFRGRAVTRCDPLSGQVELGDRHRAVIELPADFPRSAPQIALETPVAHPNLSTDGRVPLVDLNLRWSEDLDLSVVVERLWDTLRGAIVDWNDVVNPAASDVWRRSAHRLPWDRRALAPQQPLPNVVAFRVRSVAAPAENQPATEPPPLWIGPQGELD